MLEVKTVLASAAESTCLYKNFDKNFIPGRCSRFFWFLGKFIKVRKNSYSAKVPNIGEAMDWGKYPHGLTHSSTLVMKGHGLSMTRLAV